MNPSDLRTTIRDLGATQREFAAALDMSSRNLRYWLTGEVKTIDDVRVARAVGRLEGGQALRRKRRVERAQQLLAAAADELAGLKTKTTAATVAFETTQKLPAQESTL